MSLPILFQDQDLVVVKSDRVYWCTGAPLTGRLRNLRSRRCAIKLEKPFILFIAWIERHLAR
jgi:hypothetical protein